MAVPELTPLQKYEQFKNSSSQYKKMSFSQVCSIMVEQKILTAAETQELSKSLFSAGFNSNATIDLMSSSTYEPFGLSLNNQNNKTKPSNYVELPKKHHSVVTSLELNNDGKVNLNTFTLSALKSTYPSDKYSVQQFKDTQFSTIVVKDNKENVVLSVTDTIQGKSITFHSGKDSYKSVQVNKLGEIEFYVVAEPVGDNVRMKRFNPNDRFPNSTFELYPNGSRLMTNIDSKTGKIKFEDFWEKGANSATWSIEYSDGKPYKKVQGDKVEYILVNDLDKDITATNAIGLPTTRSSLSDNVLKRITYENVLETLDEYKNSTGRDLIQDINEEYGLSQTLRNKLINHIESLYYKAADSEESGKLLANKLYEDIQGLGSGKLKEHVNMINSKNLKYVLTEYKTLAFQDNSSTNFNIFDIVSKLNIDVSSEDVRNLSSALAPIEGLLTAINGEIGLKESTRKNLIKQIVLIALNEKPSDVKTRIGKDIESHSEDYHKIEVDLYRANNAEGGDLRNPELKQNRMKTSENKTFSGQIKQDRTGDCWLLAALNSAIAKPEMLNRLEKQVTLDPNTGDYVVHLKGAKKVYRITREDLDSYTTLAIGSEKVNAVEIAMDKYIRDDAYADREDLFSIDEKFGFVHNVTIDGNWSKFLWNTLLGNNYTPGVIDPKTEDFNNPNRVYSMSLEENGLTSVIAKSEKEDRYFFIERHAYSILGSDDKNIYLSNPWDSADKITISRDEFAKLSCRIEFYEPPIFSNPDQGTSL